MAGCHQKEGGFCICVTSDEIQGGLIPGPVPSIPGGISCNTGCNQRVDLPAARQNTASQDQQQLQAPTSPETHVYSSALFRAPDFENTPHPAVPLHQRGESLLYQQPGFCEAPQSPPARLFPCAPRNSCTPGAGRDRGEGLALGPWDCRQGSGGSASFASLALWDSFIPMGWGVCSTAFSSWLLAVILPSNGTNSFLRAVSAELGQTALSFSLEENKP